VAFFIGSAFGGRGTRGAVAIGLVAAAAILPIGLLALGSAAVARGLAALRGAGGRFRAVSGAAWAEARWIEEAAARDRATLEGIKFGGSACARGWPSALAKR
jgi:hypothetical protein